MTIDEQAVAICEQARDAGTPAIFLRVKDDGNVLMIGPLLPARLMCRLLHQAAEQYATDYGLRSVN